MTCIPEPFNWQGKNNLFRNLQEKIIEKSRPPLIRKQQKLSVYAKKCEKNKQK